MNKNELNKLYRYALALSRDEDLAYDLLQSSLERALKKGIESMDEPIAYIKVIIRNMFFDQQRRNKIVPLVSIDQCEDNYESNDNETSLEDIYIQKEDVAQIIEMLSTSENELLYLWAVEGYTAEEISKLLKQPRGTVLSNLHRLKKRIRQKFNQDTLNYVG